MADDNNLPDLIEVIMRAPKSDGGEDHEVRVELRVNSVSLTTDECLEFVVELDRAFISLDLDGMEVMPQTRFGEPTKSNDISVDYKMTKELNSQVGISTSAEVNASAAPSAGFMAKFLASADKKKSSTMTAQSTEKLLRVKARGNLKWEITEPTLSGGNAVLGDTYLNNEVLCKVKATVGANRMAARLAAFARKRDLRITPSVKAGKFNYKNRNQEIMVNTVIAKAISFNRANGGTLTFSISEVVIEGD